MKTRLFSAIIFLLLTIEGISQLSARFGYEAGIVTSMPQKFTSISGITYSAHSLISPLPGVKWEFDISDHTNLSIGLQYELFGTRYKNTKMPPYSYEYIERITIHKLCVPVGAVIILNNERKSFPVFSFGIRPQINLSGKYYNQRYQPLGQGYVIEDEYNPLISGWRLHSAERFSVQGYAGITKRFKRNDLTLTFIPGYFLKFTHFEYPIYTRKLWDHEVSLSLVHFFSNKAGDQNHSVIKTSPDRNPANEDVEKMESQLKNSLGINLGYMEGNLFYERSINSSHKNHWRVRAGIGLYTNPDSGGIIWNVYNMTFIYLTGEKNSHIELNGGVKYLDMRKDASLNQIIPDLFAGYRYEKPNGRFFFRAGICNVEVINPSLAIGFGHKF